MNEDKVIQEILLLRTDVDGIKEKMEVFDTKLDTFGTLVEGQDKMMQILLRLDQERVFINERVNCLDKRVENIENIAFIKTELQPS